MKLIDLSVSIEDGLPVDPPTQIPRIEYRRHGTRPSIETFLAVFPGLKEEDLLDGCGWTTEFLHLQTHAGTHMDAPYHYHPTMNHGEPAWTIDQVPLEYCIGDGVMVDFSDKPDGYCCTSKDFKEYFQKVGYTLKAGDIVLLHTAAPSKWGSSEYLKTGCGVGREGTLWLASQGVKLVGTDAWSWDPPLCYEAARFKETGDASVAWEGHKAGAECVYMQMEKLTNLDRLPPYGFRFIGFPVKVKEASAGWVRAVAVLDE